VGELVFRCPNHQPLEVPLAIVRTDFSAAEKDVVTVRKHSDRHSATGQPIEVASARDLVQTGTGPLPLIGDDMDLVPLLQQASNEELAPLVEYILNKGGWSAELDATIVFKKHYPNHRMYADDIAAEIQMFGANTLTSDLLRKGRGVRYREIVGDVAKRCDVRSQWGAKVEDIESGIIEAVLTRACPAMTLDECKIILSSLKVHEVPGLKGAASIGALQAAIQAGGFLPYQAAVVVSNGLAHATLGHGLSYAANAALTRGMANFAGPVGWAFTALLGSMALGGPAYRVTIPCVVQVGLIRQTWFRRLEEERKRRRKRRIQIMLWFAIAIMVFALVFYLPDLYCYLFSCAQSSTP
jgi:uncharacterized protein YaaW (UPF0174 family)